MAKLWKRIPGSVYKRVFDNSKAYHGTFIVVFVSPALTHVVGFTASRKVGESVERNYARRLMKEAFRSVSPSLMPDFAYVLVARKPIVASSVEDVRHELARLTAQYRQQ
ncbi:ribonuclease P protein component [Candidatus Cryosericum terrychapinii]|uniref:Ribonuclease P protein component n=1 Tax=Candidatus Cryosericum terrychapinii TaxID=2290919 RepID=A0A398CTH2_9BACT|nr:ribonuclease P protein component [Candidatus Cryosericum terrychapinii]RIE06686.1 ribonuclease P protein component [Candidatus Cryosericum terrychapinii]